MQGNLLDGLHLDLMREAGAAWTLPDLPNLSGETEVFVDFESTGLKWWKGDHIIGAGVATMDGRAWYLPVRHQGGPNIPEHGFFQWMVDHLAGKKITNIRTKFDLHLARTDPFRPINFDDLGCTFGDVAHYAALLDDHRTKFNQNDLVKDLLGEDVGKVTSSHGFTLDPSKFASYPPGLVAERAIHDVLSVRALRAKMWPQLTAQDLHRVRALEDSIIPVVVEMEHNGAPLDQETLATWVTRAQRELEDALWEIQRTAGVKLSSPTNRADQMKLFNTLRIAPPEDPEEPGKISFADALLAPIEHPTVQTFRFALQMSSLLSKFLLKYQTCTERDGILRYELHQLPYERDDEKGGGAVSGRFSSAAPGDNEGANIQQVFNPKRQAKRMTKDYPIRRLFVPGTPGAVWFAADARQIEYRLFAHYANSESIIAAYQNNPLTDYHELVQRLIKDIAHKDLIREDTKNVNFAQIYGAGVPKMAAQLGVPESVAQELSDIYHGMFPEVKPLLRKVSHLAMPEHKTGDRGCGRACREFLHQGLRHRGYVRTALGRRARFGPYDRHYSALNRVIQGTAADVNKLVMVEAYKERKRLGLVLRFTVHDELNADLLDAKMRGDVQKVLDTQYMDFRVPILWESGIGPSWAEAKG